MNQISKQPKLFPKTLFSVYKIHRFILAEALLIMLAAVFTPMIELSNPQTQINTVGKALWWSLETVTNTGYGDLIPVTGLGKVIAVILMFSGFTLYSVVVGIFVLYVSRHESRRHWQRTQLELDDLEVKIDRLLSQQGFLIKQHSGKNGRH